MNYHLDGREKEPGVYVLIDQLGKVFLYSQSLRHQAKQCIVLALTFTG